MVKQIFLVADDKNTLDFIRAALTPPDYRITPYPRIYDFFTSVRQQIPHLILLDLPFPGFTGVDAIREIRSNDRLKHIPLIVLSRNGSEMDKAKSLEAGADDYLQKPAGALELAARIRAVLRRGCNIETATRYCYKDIILDSQSHEVYKGNTKINLTLKEYTLLQSLLENKGCALSREQLSKKLWDGQNSRKARVLDIHMKTLRAKIGDDPKKPRYISTIRNFGYAIDNQGT